MSKKLFLISIILIFLTSLATAVDTIEHDTEVITEDIDNIVDIGYDYADNNLAVATEDKIKMLDVETGDTIDTWTTPDNKDIKGLDIDVITFNSKITAIADDGLYILEYKQNEEQIELLRHYAPNYLNLVYDVALTEVYDTTTEEIDIAVTHETDEAEDELSIIRYDIEEDEIEVKHSLGDNINNVGFVYYPNYEETFSIIEREDLLIFGDYDGNIFLYDRTEEYNLLVENTETDVDTIHDITVGYDREEYDYPDILIGAESGLRRLYGGDIEGLAEEIEGETDKVDIVGFQYPDDNIYFYDGFYIGGDYNSDHNIVTPAESFFTNPKISNDYNMVAIDTKRGRENFIATENTIYMNSYRHDWNKPDLEILSFESDYKELEFTYEVDLNDFHEVDIHFISSINGWSYAVEEKTIEEGEDGQVTVTYHYEDDMDDNRRYNHIPIDFTEYEHDLTAYLVSEHFLEEEEIEKNTLSNTWKQLEYKIENPVEIGEDYVKIPLHVQTASEDYVDIEIELEGEYTTHIHEETIEEDVQKEIEIDGLSSNTTYEINGYLELEDGYTDTASLGSDYEDEPLIFTTTEEDEEPIGTPTVDLQVLETRKEEADIEINVNSREIFNEFDLYIEFEEEEREDDLGSFTIEEGEEKTIEDTLEDLGAEYNDSIRAKVFYEEEGEEQSIVSDFKNIEYSEEEDNDKTVFEDFDLRESIRKTFNSLFGTEGERGENIFSMFIAMLIGIPLAVITKSAIALLWTTVSVLTLFTIAGWFPISLLIVLTLIGAIITGFLTRTLLDWDG